MPKHKPSKPKAVQRPALSLIAEQVLEGVECLDFDSAVLIGQYAAACPLLQVNEWYRQYTLPVALGDREAVGHPEMRQMQTQYFVGTSLYLLAVSADAAPSTTTTLSAADSKKKQSKQQQSEIVAAAASTSSGGGGGSSGGNREVWHDSKQLVAVLDAQSGVAAYYDCAPSNAQCASGTSGMLKSKQHPAAAAAAPNSAPPTKPDPYERYALTLPEPRSPLVMTRHKPKQPQDNPQPQPPNAKQSEAEKEAELLFPHSAKFASTLPTPHLLRVSGVLRAHFLPVWKSEEQSSAPYCSAEFALFLSRRPLYFASPPQPFTASQQSQVRAKVEAEDEDEHAAPGGPAFLVSPPEVTAAAPSQAAEPEAAPSGHSKQLTRYGVFVNAKGTALILCPSPTKPEPAPGVVRIHQTTLSAFWCLSRGRGLQPLFAQRVMGQLVTSPKPALCHAQWKGVEAEAGVGAGGAVFGYSGGLVTTVPNPIGRTSAEVMRMRKSFFAFDAGTHTHNSLTLHNSLLSIHWMM
jgi:hypothetical protein